MATDLWIPTYLLVVTTGHVFWDVRQVKIEEVVMFPAFCREAASSKDLQVNLEHILHLGSMGSDQIFKNFHGQEIWK